MKTVALSGLTGQGVETAGEMLASMLAQKGLNYRTWRDFSTIIRGGITSYEIAIVESEVENKGANPARTRAVDVAVVFDDEGACVYRSRMALDGHLFGSQHVSELQHESTEEVPKLGYNIWALGLISGALGIDQETLLATVLEKFPDDDNRLLAMRGYRKGLTCRIMEERSGSQDMVRMSGNQALSLGALAGGVRFYCGYPITPASDILEILMAKLPEVDGVAFQVEDEIAAIHMAVGASYAGERTFVATSGPGLSLMTEGIGYAATIEVPLVVVDNQRGGPSTGMPTKTEQSDLNHVLYGGHGEFGRIVLAPTTILDSVAVMQEALNLADRYQCVVLMVLDLDMAMNQKSYPWSIVDPLLTAIPIDRGKTILRGSMESYRRFEEKDGGLPERSIPGVVGGEYVASGDEHDERGWMEPDFLQVRSTLHLRRLHKVDEISYGRPWDRLGKESAPIVLVGMGSMSELIGAAIERYPDEYQGLLVRQLAPLPEMPLWSTAVRQLIVAEYNATGQLMKVLESVMPRLDMRGLRRFDGEHFTEEEFVERLKSMVSVQRGQVV